MNKNLQKLSPCGLQPGGGAAEWGRRLAAAVLTLTLAASVYGCTINVPVTRIETGATQTAAIQVPLPENLTNGVELQIEFVAGQMNLTPGASGYLAVGTATFNVDDLRPVIDTAGSSITLRSGDMKVEGIPIVDQDVKNEWDVQLADTPMSLVVQAGAYDASFELGGLSLEKLAISDGGSDFKGSFSTPNQVVMSSFTFSTGASNTKLTGLANANFEEMIFNSGAGDYTLSFDGKLQRDAVVRIDSGLATVNILVPEGVNAALTFEGGFSTVNANGGWSQNGSVYTLSGSGPMIEITVKMGMGTLNLETE